MATALDQATATRIVFVSQLTNGILVRGYDVGGVVDEVGAAQARAGHNTSEVVLRFAEE